MEKRKLVLIVDDDEGTRELLEFILTREGLRVACASDGPASLAKLKDLTPDAVVLDLMLPGIGGRELLRRLRTDGLSRVPVFVVTARLTDRATAEAIRGEPNVAALLAKPFAPVELAKAIVGALGPDGRSC